jgi:hypothetical protein
MQNKKRSIMIRSIMLDNYRLICNKINEQRLAPCMHANMFLLYYKNACLLTPFISYIIEEMEKVLLCFYMYMCIQL